MTIIGTQKITKRFADTIAVNKVSIHVQEGEIYGFLGLNGAGKTTLIRMLLGLIKPDEGNCKLFDTLPKQATNIWNRVGYMIETPHAYQNLTVYENLKVIAKLRVIYDIKAINAEKSFFKILQEKVSVNLF